MREKTEIRIGFLFINTMAHVAHAAPVAFELSTDRRFRVILYVSTIENKELLEKIALNYPGHGCEYQFLVPSLGYRVKSFFGKRLFPRVKNVLKNNVFELLKCDALVMPDKNFEIIMDKDVERRTKFISTFHGAGDGLYGFKQQWGKFDFLLIYGDQWWKRLTDSGVLSSNKGEIVGYPKFDLVTKGSGISFFNNDKPVVLYNPHFKKHLSSWYKWGMKILDYFHNDPSINLIFAPHIMLFQTGNISIPRKYYEASNIHIDMGSSSLVDMTYIQASDVYLGDVSSQVYEFLHYKPRPCVFLDAHDVAWENDPNYRMWQMGDVLDRIDGFDRVIGDMFNKHKSYCGVQKTYVADMFSTSEIPSGRRAAEAIVGFLEKEERL